MVSQRPGQVQQAGCPPSSNTGGKFLSSPVVSIDWLTFTYDFDKCPLADMQGLLSSWFGIEVRLVHQTQGWLGFASRANIVLPIEGDAITVGLVAWGGVSQRGRACVSVSGRGCGLVPASRWALVRSSLEALGARLTRVDLAADDLEGRYSVDLAASWYIAGAFGTGGNAPSCDQRGNWLKPDGKGRTLNIGKQSNGKGLCIYEKGKQLGDEASPWVRWELRYGNRDRVIPLEMLTMTASYFVGGYKCLDQVVTATAAKIKTTSAVVEKSLAKLTAYARTSYGKLIHVLLSHHGGDYVAVVSSLHKRGVPESLTGAWMGRHEFSG